MERMISGSSPQRISVLFIAPLPPPVTGQALACGMLLDELRRTQNVYVVNFNKGTFAQGANSFSRLFEVVKILANIMRRQEKADVIYLTISQSIAGNIKDLVTYLLCYKKLPQMIIHLHGGGIKKIIFDKYPLLRFVNKIFLKRIGGAVVLGDSLRHIFTDMVPQNRIHVVRNFADDSLFASREDIRKKYTATVPLRVLFLSNLIPGKGYDELVDAYMLLDDELKNKVQVDFAGGFESAGNKRTFLEKTGGIPGITYHGTVSGKAKQDLFSRAHVFCLPTYYRYLEGQPLSILEAYAAGCVVLTTDHGGIRDVFRHGENGFYVEKQSPVSIKNNIEHVMQRQEQLERIALNNRQLAEEQYSKVNYILSLTKIINEAVNQK